MISVAAFDFFLLVLTATAAEELAAVGSRHRVVRRSLKPGVLRPTDLSGPFCGDSLLDCFQWLNTIFPSRFLVDVMPVIDSLTNGGKGERERELVDKSKKRKMRNFRDFIHFEP